MAEEKPSFYKSRAHKFIDATLPPIVGGIMRIGQGVAGAAESVADYSKSEASKATPTTKDEHVGWRDIPRKVWQTLTEPHAQQEARAIENSRQYQKQLTPVADAVKKEAHNDYEFAKREGDKIESNLGTVGKVVMKATEAAPQIALSGRSKALKLANTAYGLASEMGKEKKASAAIPQALSEAVIKGNSVLSNTIQPVVEEGIKAVSGFFTKRKAPEVAKAK